MKRHADAAQHRLALAVLLAAIAGVLACAPKQKIPLDVGPDGVALYLNGEMLDDVPESLTLRANRNHTLFFKREGYQSQFVLLRSSGEKRDAVLTPEAVNLELLRVQQNRPNLSLEIEDDPDG